MIREATVQDCPRMAEIHVFGWRCAYRNFISPDFLFNKLTVKKREEKFLGFLSDKNNDDKTYVFEEDSIVKAFMTIGNCRDEDKNDAAFELEGIYVDPLFQRKKIGTRLVDFCREEAVRKNKREITLWVFAKNSDSINFYTKMGFDVDGKTKLMELFNEMAIRMSKKI